MHVPKLRPEQRTEVPELAAAAAVGTQDAATSSQRFHVPGETANAQRVGGWAFTNSVAILGKMAHRHPLKRTHAWRHTVPICIVQTVKSSPIEVKSRLERCSESMDEKPPRPVDFCTVVPLKGNHQKKKDLISASCQR